MFFYISVFVIKLYYLVFYKVKIYGFDNLPKNGGFILCSNHTSVNDPMVLGSFMKRPVHFLAKKEIYKNPFFAFFLKKLKTIPIDRSAPDMNTFKTVINLLKDGKGVGIFAQGTRVKSDEVKEAKAGVALFALKSQVPIVPVNISSSYKHFSKLLINIGEPIYLEMYYGEKIKSDKMGIIADGVMDQIKKLALTY